MLVLDYALGYANSTSETVGPTLFYWTCYFWLPMWGVSLSLLYLSRTHAKSKIAEKFGSSIDALFGGSNSAESSHFANPLIGNASDDYTQDDDEDEESSRGSSAGQRYPRGTIGTGTGSSHRETGGSIATAGSHGRISSGRSTMVRSSQGTNKERSSTGTGTGTGAATASNPRCSFSSHQEQDSLVRQQQRLNNHSTSATRPSEGSFDSNMSPIPSEMNTTPNFNSASNSNNNSLQCLSQLSGLGGGGGRTGTGSGVERGNYSDNGSLTPQEELSRHTESLFVSSERISMFGDVHSPDNSVNYLYRDTNGSYYDPLASVIHASNTTTTTANNNNSNHRDGRNSH
eukprot:CAMPEP_0174964346 /NCGR_PEP_ID=MMETSP0004_2-20121128/5826_1 /TAXON_ID=420556 /ORGANISM="Ochromonas sp., Strain CCMP1393" /LENGTH=343 /DNA_ID=CAMNT_0016213055 /DNA_START=700 /DNA_END=1731 /DNA_ORIENTATION=-